MRVCAIFVALLFAVLSADMRAQTASGTLRGRITDPSGAVIPKATVAATGADGKSATVVSNPQGVYEIKGLAAGAYTVTVTAKGFAVDQEAAVEVTAGQVQQFDIALSIAVEKQNVEVQEETPTVDVSSQNSAGTLVLKGKDLDALSDDPDELQSELQALAGPSAGPNGGQIYVDGFSAGELPPKSAIREIRINQNPFSAEYDKLGYGRIEIFTKPGTDKFHGQFMVNGNSSAFNALNPFVTEEPGYYSEIFNGNISGPLGKKASFFVTVQQRNIDNVSVVVAQILNPNNVIVPYNTTVPSPQTRLNISPRADFQLSQNNTLTVRYQYSKNDQDNEGIGQFSLPTQGFNSNSTEQTVQISDTQVLSPTMVNETRFQYIRDSSNQVPLSDAPTLNVLGAFNGGGSPGGTVISNQDHYELQNYTSIAHGTSLHQVRRTAARDAVLQQRELQFQWHLYFPLAKCISDHANRAARRPDADANPQHGRRSQPVFPGCRAAVVRRFYDRHRSLRRRRVENPPQHFTELWFALRNPDRHPVRRELGPAREPGLGTRPVQSGTQDGAACGIWNLLRPLLLQLPAGGGTAERRDPAAVCCQPARLLSADSSAQRAEQAGENLAHGVSGFSHPAHTVHNGRRRSAWTARSPRTQRCRSPI